MIYKYIHFTFCTQRKMFVAMKVFTYIYEYYKYIYIYIYIFIIFIYRLKTYLKKVKNVHVFHIITIYEANNYVA